MKQIGTTRRAAFFDTLIGGCAVAWSERGIAALELPSSEPAATRRSLERKLGAVEWNEPPTAVRRTIAGVQRHLGGLPWRDGARARLDLSGCPRFAQRVYEELRSVPPGQTISYGELGARVGNRSAARAVGRAMAENPVPLLVPCHRVVTGDGALGSFSAFGGAVTKLRLLSLEGADLGPIARGGVRQLRRADSRLARVMRRVGRYTLAESQGRDHFTALARAIVHQQVSTHAAATIFGRLSRIAGRGGRLSARRLLALSADELRAAGVSRQKAGYLRDLAEQLTAGQLPLARAAHLDDEAVISALIRVRGLGRWSVQMFLMFRLGRLDVLPVDDLGLRKGAQLVYGGARPLEPTELHRLAERWRPFRSIATWYLWRALDGGGLR